MLLTKVRADALRALIPPPRLRLSQWIEANIVLPEGTSALPGKVRLWPYQREIAEAAARPRNRISCGIRGCGKIRP
jgi:phage terminase large subunit GpA-like protein